MSLLVRKKYLENCPICGQGHEVEERETDAQVIIKGQEISYKERYYYCENADPEECEFVTAKMANQNLLRARDNYRRQNHLLTSQEIISIRKDYNLSQVELSRLLGWGEATISRYESKSIQDASHDSMLRLIQKIPLEILDLLERNGAKFTTSRKKEIQKKVQENLDSYGKENLSRNAVISNYISYMNPSDKNGQTCLNIDKVEAMISYIAEHVNDLYKVKLMKMMWYADSLAFKENGHAISGLVYQHKNMGALPLGHRNIVDLANVNVKEEWSDNGFEMMHFYPSSKAKYYVLSEKEKRILDKVIEKFRYYNAKRIIKYMHQEEAYIKTKDDQIIPFSLAKKIREF